MLLDDVLYFPGDSRNLLLWDETTGIATGGFEDFQWVVTDATQPMKVALCWTDYQGNPASGVQLVNNLNLTATNGATTYLGNVFASGQR